MFPSSMRETFFTFSNHSSQKICSCQNSAYIYTIKQTQKHNKMDNAEVNTELKNTKKVMNKLMNCIKAGQMEYYNDYLKISVYYLKLSRK